MKDRNDEILDLDLVTLYLLPRLRLTLISTFAFIFFLRVNFQNGIKFLQLSFVPINGQLAARKRGWFKSWSVERDKKLMDACISNNFLYIFFMIGKNYWKPFQFLIQLAEVFMAEASSFPCEKTFARFDNFKALLWHKTLVPKLKSRLILPADFSCFLKKLSASSIRRNHFESSVFLVLTCVFCF